MDVRGPSLYRALVERFGEVRISNQGQPRKAVRLLDGTERVQETGEAYNVCCPECGDERFRLSISYAWLMKTPDGSRRVDLINCYNENCRSIYKKQFWLPFAEAIDSGAVMDRLVVAALPPPPPPEPIRLPKGCVPLQSLGADHVAVEFVRTKYPHLDPRVLGERYGVLYTDQPDERFRLAQFRIVFPMYQDGELYSWQARTVNPVERVRWLFPPGFVKTLYRRDELDRSKPLVLAEGITSSISCGENATAIFGKQLDDIRAQWIGKNFKAVVIATDPETFVPDRTGKGKPRIYANEMKDLLSQYVTVRMLRWPKEALELGAIKTNPADPLQKTVKVPDPADYGPTKMQELIQEALLG